MKKANLLAIMIGLLRERESIMILKNKGNENNNHHSNENNHGKNGKTILELPRQVEMKITDKTYLSHNFTFREDELNEPINSRNQWWEKLVSSLQDELAKILSQEFIFMEEKKVWMDTKLLALYPKPEAYEIPVIFDDEKRVRDYKEQIEGFSFVAPEISDLRVTFDMNRNNPFLGKNLTLNFICAVTNISEHHSPGSNHIYKYEDIIPDHLATKTPVDSHLKIFMSYASNVEGSIYSHTYSSSKGCLLLPICYLNKPSNTRITRLNILAALCKNRLVPVGLEKRRAEYAALMNHWDRVQPFLQEQQGIIQWNGNAFKKEYESYLRKNLQNRNQDSQFISTLQKAVQKELLECDYLRANITPYDERRLTDINLGHWELAETPEKSSQIPLSDGVTWVARPPQMDVRYGVCAIDFGTKSTVVACRDEKQDERLRRVGKGDFSAAPQMSDFENPTTIELRHYRNFQKGYQKREGRPFTKWADVTVSHEAANAIFNAVYNGAYYSVFNELKQWANDPNRRMLLTDLDKDIIELKPYQDIREGDFDPIEIYAYYLGLYINNMTNGIYLDYILSFPVNYSVGTREKIRKSFERGIRKSLPPAILQDSEMMKHFRIQQGCSEPAAYAITALREFGLEPQKEGDIVAYAVFDFGGGTTDFDFGVASVPSSRYNLQIEQFGYGGDPYLGGENLLLKLAYEVFRDNVEVMRQKKIHMVLPAEERRFTGSEVLVEDRQSASQEAYLNTRELQKFLRPIWEKTEGYETLGQGEQSIELYPSGGGKKEQVSLRVDIARLDQLIQERINQGVENFFAKLLEAFQNRDYNGKIHIFLAGNSCKSAVVQNLFHKHIQEAEAEMKKDQGASGLYELHLPLPVQKVEQANKENAKGQSHEWDRLRTGKTGVAFGLLRCRKGARDVKVINKNDEAGIDQKEVRFPYYLGEIQRDGKFQITIGMDVGYGVWAEYIDASEDEFELCYTKDARAQKKELLDRDIPRVTCYLDDDEVSDDEDVVVAIRKVDPESIEYAVGKIQNDGENPVFTPNDPQKIHKKSLR